MIPIYDDTNNDRINIVQSVASASTMISSIAAHMKDYILSNFPDGFFKHYYIDTSDTVTQQNINRNYNANANKIEYPSISVTPEISLDDPIGGMNKSLFMSSPNLYLRRDRRSYKKIMFDPKDKFSLHYTCDYITTNFNFKIITNSYIQNANMTMYLKSRFQTDFFQFINHREIQTEIPKSFIKIIAAILGLDIEEQKDMDYLRLYLISSSLTEDSIKKRVNTGTGKECFFINEMQNLLVQMSDLDCPPSVVRDGQTEGEYIITFRLQVSSYLPNSFILNVDRKTFLSLGREYLSESTYIKDQDEGFFSMSINASKKETKDFLSKDGTKLIGVLTYFEEYTFQQGDDLTIYLLPKLSADLKKAHAYAVDKGLDISSLFSIDVITKDGKLPYSAYTVDEDTLILRIESNIQSDFVPAVYVNRLMLETINEAIKQDMFYFNSNYLTSIIANIDDNTVFKDRITVRSFANEREKRDITINKSLRVQTAYGVGYIQLEDSSEDDDLDSYRICIGFDKDNNPIIKRLELNMEAI